MVASMESYYASLRKEGGQTVPAYTELEATTENIDKMLSVLCKMPKYKDHPTTWDWILRNDFSYFNWYFRRVADPDTNLFRLLAPICMTTTEIVTRKKNAADGMKK